MLSLIVALAPAGAPGASAAGGYRFALASDAAPEVAGGAPGADRALADHGNAPLALLPRSDELVAVVPAAMLSWHRITLPRINAARLRAALDGLLEDRLLDDPASLHLALAPGATPGAATWVAACDKAWLQAALHPFEAAGRPVSRVVPEAAPLAAGSAPQLIASGSGGSGDAAWLMRIAEDGVQTLPLLPGVRALLGLDGPGAAAADATTCLAEPAVAALAEQVLGLKVRVRHSGQALVASARSGWDLAQFDLASTGGSRLARRAGQAWAQWLGSAAWRPARWGLVTLLLVNLLGLNAWAWKERSALDAKRAELRSLLTRSFPAVPVVIDPPLQMERELAVLRGATGAVSARDLEPVLANIAAVAGATPSPAAMEFVAYELTLKGFAPAAAQADALRTRLAAAGYDARAEGNGWVVRVARQGSSPAMPAKGQP